MRNRFLAVAVAVLVLPAAVLAATWTVKPDGTGDSPSIKAAILAASNAVIERVLSRLAEGVDGVVPGLPLADTVKRIEGGLVAETIDRGAIVAVQTPQAFLAERLRAAYAGDLHGATDCASLVERMGGRVAVVAGDPRLVKVTASEDLELVSSLLAAG